MAIVFFVALVAILLIYRKCKPSPDDADASNHTIYRSKVLQRAEGGSSKDKAYSSRITSETNDNLLEFQELVKSDPAKALSFLRNRSKGEFDPQLYRILFLAWAKHDPKQAFDEAKSPSNRDIQSIAVEAVLSVVLKSNSKFALTLLVSLNKSSNGKFLAASFFNKWAEMDVRGLKESLSEIQSTEYRAVAISSIAVWSALHNPAEAINWINTLTNSADQREALNGLIIGWARSSPTEALSYLESRDGGDIDQSLIASLMMEWTKSDPHAALEWTEKIKDANIRQVAITTIITSMLDNQLPYAETLKFVDDLSTGKLKDDAMSVLVNNWNGDSFKELADAAYLGGSSIAGTGGEASLAKKWVAAKPMEAIEYLKALNSMDSAPMLSREVLRYMATKDPAGATELAYQFSMNGNPRLVSKVLQGLLEASPEVAKSLIVKLDGSQVGEDLANRFATSYGRKNPAAALDWINHDVPESRREALTRTILNGWVDFDQVGASEYVTKMPDSKLKDTSASSISLSIAGSDIANSLKWAVSIKSEILRRQTLAEIGKYINYNDPKLNSEDIINSGILDDEIQLLENNGK